MTSPVQDKPDNTTSIYADVYAPGLSNSYGQNLRKGTPAETERAVKDLFLQQASAPFDNALGNFADFAGRLLKEIADAIGAILGGAVNAGAAVFGVVVDGVAGFIQGIATFISNIFDRWSGRKSPEPLPPVYSQIETDLEAATKPMFDAVDLSLTKADEALAEADTLRTDITASLTRVDKDVATAQALVDATKYVQTAITSPHLDLTPKASNGRPLWSSGANAAGTIITSEGLQVRAINLPSTSNGATALTEDTYFTTTPGMDLRVRFAVRVAASATSSVFNFRLYNKAGTRVISETKLLAEGRLRDLTPVKDPQWVTEPNLHWERSTPEKGTWWEYDVAIRLAEGTDAARIQVMSHYNEMDFAGPHIGAHFPIQAMIDEAQNTAIGGLSEAVRASDAVLTQHQVALEEISEATKTTMQALGEAEEFIPRLLVVPDARYGTSSNKPYLQSPHVQVRFDSSSALLVDARGTSWMGLIVVTANYQTDPSAISKHGVTKYYEFPVTAGQGRTFSVPRSSSHGDIDSARIDYFVQKGTIQDREANESFSTPLVAPADPAWTQRTALRFPVEASETTQHTIEYKVDWYSAAKDNAIYKIRLTKTSPSGTTVLKTLSRALLGPTFPWEDGRRTTTLLWNGPLGPGEVVNFEATVGTTGGEVISDQRRIYATERKVSWVSNKI